VSINFGMKNVTNTDLLVRIIKLKNKYKGLKLKHKGMVINDKVKSELLKIQYYIAKYTNEYKLIEETQVDSKVVVTAFVTFRSMEGAERANSIKINREFIVLRLLKSLLGK
jgi:hypothetical protein